MYAIYVRISTKYESFIKCSHHSVQQQQIEYKKSMGGVDLADMLIALYRCKVKTKRWPVLLIFHAIEIAKVNACLEQNRFPY